MRSETERTVEALTVAMAFAPGVYARNRMFAFFAKEGVQRARGRASTLRGIIAHLARAHGVVLSSEGGGRASSGEPTITLRYHIPSMRLSRVATLTRTELATLRLLAARAGAPCLPPDDDDRAIVDGALARLLEAGIASPDQARAARHASTPPPAG